MAKYVYVFIILACCAAVTVNCDPIFLTTPLADECYQIGVTCTNDCNRLIYCLDNTGNNYDVIDDCSRRGMFCDTYTDSCVEEQPARCRHLDTNFPFTCTSPDIFPDPFNCSNYYGCIRANVTGVNAECDAGQLFDVTAEMCTSVTGCFESISCRRLGECDQIDNSRYFYVCLRDVGTGVIGPRIHHCLNGVQIIYSLDNLNSCSCKTSVGPPTSSTTSTEPTTEPPTEPPTESPIWPPFPSTESICSMTGQTVAYPNNCNYYYYCDSSLEPILRACPTGYFYDIACNGCVIGNC